MKVSLDFSLESRNTLALKSSCARHIECESVADVIEWSRQGNFEPSAFFVLGGGSNLILPEYYEGTVISSNIRGFSIDDEGKKDDLYKLKVGSGESWDALIKFCLDKGLRGLENLTLIPGTVGAAPIQNIGAYGVEVCEYIESVEVYNFINKRLEVLSNKDCLFSYRDSIFKQNPGKYLVLNVNFLLSKGAELNLSYKTLQALIEKKGLMPCDLDAHKVSALVAEVRRERLPDPKLEANVGSFFKNPIISNDNFEKLIKRFPDLVSFSAGLGSKKLSAAWLIEQCGWKGKAIGNMKVSDRHSLVLVNTGARGETHQSEVLAFANLIKEDVAANFGIILETEPVIK